MLRYLRRSSVKEGATKVGREAFGRFRSIFQDLAETFGRFTARREGTPRPSRPLGIAGRPQYDLTLSTRIFLCSCGGLVLGLAFSRSEFSWIAWIALIPLMIATDGQSFRTTFGYAWVHGMCFFSATLYWLAITYHHYADRPFPDSVGRVILLSSFEATFLASSVTAGVLIERRTRAPLVVTLPVAWVSGEYLRSLFPVEFPWGFLGDALYRDLKMIQIAEFTGVYGLSALIVLANVAAFRLLFGRRSRTARLTQAISGAIVVVAVLAFGNVRTNQLDHASPVGVLKVGMVQGGLPQTFHFQRQSIATSFKVYKTATMELARQRPDLIVWPENAIGFVFQPNDIYPSNYEIEKSFRTQILDLARGLQEPILFGAPSLYFQDGISMRNRAYLISSQGQVDGYYDKIKLVPFSEYLPASAVLNSFMDTIVHRDIPYTAGVSKRMFEVGAARIGVLICYESLFPELSRQYADNGANVLINISNDTWSGESSAPYEFLSADVFRAVENHLPVARVANSGISAMISTTGRIEGRTELFKRTDEIETASWTDAKTIYTRFGDLFAESCLVLTLLGIFSSVLVGSKFY